MNSNASLVKPYGAVPSEIHANWHKVGRYAIVHFSVSTFHNREWGFGDESPESFNPTDFDAEQWVQACLAGGLNGLILVCKHHDGFCLWPTKTTDHSVKNSPWRDGKGDMVAEVAEACRKYGIKFGVYCSPWDRNNSEYGRDAYVHIFHEQVRELVTGYGELFEVWFDGANGGDGYYGGTRERRPIDPVEYYRWNELKTMIRKHQPNAVMFPFDLRWVGNECGVAGETCWATYLKAASPAAGGGKPGEGMREGEAWRPAECDFPLRKGWFYHENEEPKSADKLLELYFKSIGHGCSINLGLAPDTSGRICDDDIKTLGEWNKKLKGIFDYNLIDINSCRLAGSGDVQALIDGNSETFWTPENDVLQEFTIEFDGPVKFNLVELSEFVELGQRVEKFYVDYWQDGSWFELAVATSIGYQRLLLTPTTVTNRLRLRFSGCVSPAIARFGLYIVPASLMLNNRIVVSRERNGMVKITGRESGLELRYTLDGSEPDRSCALYSDPFALPEGGTVKVRGFVEDQATGIVTAAYGPARGDWRIVDVSLDSPFDNRGEAGIDKILDDDPNTYWHTYHKDRILSNPPHSVTIDMGGEKEISMVTMTPCAGLQHGGGTEAVPDQYEYQISSDGTCWTVIAEGEFSNIKANPCQQIIQLPKKYRGRYLKFIAKHVIDDGWYIKVAGVGAM